MTKLFGTDGIRGLAGAFPLNAEAIRAIGQAVGERLRGPILVGQDTRESSPWIYEMLAEGMERTASSCENAGVIPTPAIALLTRQYRYCGGVMVSASHNPYQDNGLKIFGADGAKLDDTAESQIEARVLELLGQQGGQRVDNIPERTVVASNGASWRDKYIQLLIGRFPTGAWLQGLRVVLDCAHGAMSSVAPEIFRRLGAEVQAEFVSPSGKKINEKCGAVHPEALAGIMKVAGASFGVAFDGDGDRALFVSSGGAVIDGDRILYAMARRIKRAGLLSPAVVVGTVMTNFGLERALATQGITLRRVSVGDRFIFEEMRKNCSLLGGEPSGHIIFSDFGLSGDGLLTALKVAQAVVEDGAALDDWSRDWAAAPQLLKTVPVARRMSLENAPMLQGALSRAKQAIEGRGRVVVRYSGTELALRVMIESEDASTNELLMRDLLEAARQDLA